MSCEMRCMCLILRLAVSYSYLVWRISSFWHKCSHTMSNPSNTSLYSQRRLDWKGWSLVCIFLHWELHKLNFSIINGPIVKAALVFILLFSTVVSNNVIKVSESVVRLHSSVSFTRMICRTCARLFYAPITVTPWQHAVQGETALDVLCREGQAQHWSFSYKVRYWEITAGFF